MNRERGNVHSFPIILTPTGEKFLSFAEKVLESYDCLIEEINSLKGVQKGKLMIAAPYTTLNNLLPAIVKAYIKRFPWVELSLLDRPQHVVIDLVKEGEADIGIAIESVVPAS